MLSVINLILIVLLTIFLIVGFFRIKEKYDKNIREQDKKLVKIFKQINDNDEYLKDIDVKNKDEVQALITKNTNDLGENRGYISDNIALVNAVVNKLDQSNNDTNTDNDTNTNNNLPIEGYEELTSDEIKTKQEEMSRSWSRCSCQPL